MYTQPYMPCSTESKFHCFLYFLVYLNGYFLQPPATQFISDPVTLVNWKRASNRHLHTPVIVHAVGVAIGPLVSGIPRGRDERNFAILAAEIGTLTVLISLLPHLGNPLQEDSSEEENTSLMHELAVEMVHYFRALHCVDSLMEFHHSGIGKQEVDNPEALETLRSFYVLTLDQINDRRGVKAVVRILSWSDYLGALLPFIELTGKDANG